MTLQIAAVAKIYFLQIKTWSLWFLLYTILFPLGLIFYVSVVGKCADPARLVAGGSVFTISVVSINATGYWIMTDRFQNQLELLKSMPIGTHIYYSAIILVAIVQSLVNVHALIVVLKVLRFDANYTLLILPATALISGLFCIIGILIGNFVKDTSHGSLMVNLFGSGLVFICPIFYPMSLLPESAARVIALLPHMLAFRFFYLLFK